MDQPRSPSRYPLEASESSQQPFETSHPPVFHYRANNDSLPTLPPTHFLSLARNPFRDFHNVVAPGIIDTATLAATDFDVDPRSGFMPPSPPLARLAGEHETWEVILDQALGPKNRLVLGEFANEEEQKRSEQWRALAREMPTISVQSLRNSEVSLRRAHLVLTFILHLYIHSQPPLPQSTSTPLPPFAIPACLSIPLFALSAELSLPPILTYSDNVLYNWKLVNPHLPVSQHNIRMSMTFSLTKSEEHFYITSARIELRGVEALEIMRSCMDEAFIGDALALRRISAYLQRLSVVIEELTALLMAVREDCDPGIFYNEIRPWFRGWHEGGREWLFEGVDPEQAQKHARMSGPSAGQSSLVHALDIFLGVDHSGQHHGNEGGNTSHHHRHADPGFLMRMEQYMPRHHRAFLQHLRSNDKSIRSLVAAATSEPTGDNNRNPELEQVGKRLETAYNQAVISLKKFRDGHIRIATLYIVNQARRHTLPPGSVDEVRGTGGTSLVPFLKECRDNTLRTAIGGGR